jgi:amino-acid N-acetyltransferase
VSAVSLTALKADEPAFAAMVASLRAADLPIGDLHEAPAKYFALSSGGAYGGFATFGDACMLRSLVVTADNRGSGIASALLAALLAKARAEGVREAWLLTTSAEKFFAKHGFEKADRSAAPLAIAATSQFNDLCPASAALMHLRLA